MQNEEKNALSLERILVGSTKQEIGKEKKVLLLSGGLDSSVIGKILSNEGIEFVCSFAGIKDFSEPKDLAFAIKAAGEMRRELKINLVSMEEFEFELPKIIRIIGTANPVSVGAAATFYFASKKIQKGSTVFTGAGADELFAGYNSFRKAANTNEQCRKLYKKMLKTDLLFEKSIAKNFGLKLKTPYVSKRLSNFALNLAPIQKISGEENKKILREFAINAGLSREIALRPKKAAQYGSNFDRALEKLARKNGFKTKTEYLKSIQKNSKTKIGALVSTGKDSIYALYCMQKQGFEIACIITIDSHNKDSYMFHAPEVKLAKLQAKALGLDKKLIVIKTKGEKEKELKELEKAIVLAKKKYKIKGITSGALFSEYQKSRVEKICAKLKLRSLAPLWHKNQLEYLKEIIATGFEIIITKIACYGLNEHWLGRKIDSDAIAELELLEKRFRINVAGEGGEYESLVLGAPNFSKKIWIEKSEKTMRNEFTGTFKIKKVILRTKL
ncbi:MAG: diphthine--ammonia ligase [archaeon]|jgi:asparagine synthase (glutamine-hydrolysing)